MKTLPTLCLLFVTTFSRAALSQECTSRWDTYFDTNPLHQKVLSGDTNAGYAVFAFWADPSRRFELKGRFPYARFMSLESYKSKLQLKSGAIFDEQITPDEGSQNPFREGAALGATDRAYTINVVPSGLAENFPNALELPDSSGTQVLMLRIYSPHDGVTLTNGDLPRIYAYDSSSNNPTSCPASGSIPVVWHFPQFIASIVSYFMPFEFKTGTVPVGVNAAIPKYVYAITKLSKGDVVSIRFRAPRFVQTASGVGTFRREDTDVRYWSFCTQNFNNNIALNCVPDHLSHPDANGMVHVVVGGNAETEALTRSLGYDYLPDARGPRQDVMGFAYRNIFPNDRFKNESMYQGIYNPEGKVCRNNDFVNGACAW